MRQPPTPYDRRPLGAADLPLSGGRGLLLRNGQFGARIHGWRANAFDEGGGIRVEVDFEADVASSFPVRLFEGDLFLKADDHRMLRVGRAIGMLDDRRPERRFIAVSYAPRPFVTISGERLANERASRGREGTVRARVA